MMKLFIAAFFLFITNFAPSPWINNLEKAKQIAKTEQKLILLNFSGSDWCIPCMKLHANIFNSDVFMEYAKKNLILVNADFPRQKKNELSKEQQKENDALAAKYNSDGKFPFTILLDSNGNKLRVWDGYYSHGPDDFIDELSSVKK